MASGTTVPVTHSVDAALGQVRSTVNPEQIVGLMAEPGSLPETIFRGQLQAAGYQVANQNALPGIQAIGAGNVEGGRSMLDQAAQRLVDDGARAVILADERIPQPPAIT